MEEKRKITFEDIQRANEMIKTTDIKGKDYAEVNQRVKAYRKVYPTGMILTEMINNENGICIFKASVYDEQDNIIATGTAYEKENSTFINKTSYIENCETSAVGRALGMAGFGIDTSIASADEVTNAIENQNKSETKTPYDFEEEKLTNEQMIDIGNWSIEVKDHIREKFKKEPFDFTQQEYLTVRKSLEKHGLIKTKEEEEKIKKQKELERKEKEEIF